MTDLITYQLLRTAIFFQKVGESEIYLVEKLKKYP